MNLTVFHHPATGGDLGTFIKHFKMDDTSGRTLETVVSRLAAQLLQ